LHRALVARTLTTPRHYYKVFTHCFTPAQHLEA
jgi:hypothetical protein